MYCSSGGMQYLHIWWYSSGWTESPHLVFMAGNLYIPAFFKHFNNLRKSCWPSAVLTSPCASVVWIKHSCFMTSYFSPHSTQYAKMSRRLRLLPVPCSWNMHDNASWRRFYNHADQLEETYSTPLQNDKKKFLKKQSEFVYENYICLFCKNNPICGLDWSL